MFRYEKEMIPYIKDFFSEEFKNGHFVQEFHTGIGIADLVFTPNISDRKYYFQSFDILYLILTLFNRKNRKLNSSDLPLKQSKKKINLLIDKLESLDLIEVNKDRTFKVKNKLEPSVSEFYSVEAKINDWKNGLYQALRYQNFSQKSYLAISSDFIHRVDKKELIKANIGLISVSKERSFVVINPKKNKPKDKIAFYYSGEAFTKIIHQNNIINYCPQQWV